MKQLQNRYAYSDSDFRPNFSHDKLVLCQLISKIRKSN